MLVNSLIIQHYKWYYNYRSVPAEHIYEKVIDKSSAADYEILTDIPVTQCTAYATTAFTETEVMLVGGTTDIPVTSCPAYVTTTFTETKVKIQ